MSFIWVHGNKKSYQWLSLSLRLWKEKGLGNLKMTYWRSLRSISVIAGDKRSPQSNLQVVITHASHVCSQHSFGLRMNGIHRTQLDHALLDLLSLEIWSREFDHACFDRLSPETFDLRSLSPALRNLWLSSSSSSSFISLFVTANFTGYSRLLGEETSRNHQAYIERPPRHHNIIRNKGCEEVRRN